MILPVDLAPSVLQDLKKNLGEDISSNFIVVELSTFLVSGGEGVFFQYSTDLGNKIN